MYQINWKVKSLVYKFFQFLNLEKILYLVQKHITRRSAVNINQSIHLLEMHAENIKEFSKLNSLEIGAGKSLQNSIYMAYKFNKGINQTVIDINHMLDFGLFNKASEQISKRLNLINFGEANSLYEIKDKFNINYLAPTSTRELISKKLKFDLVMSTNTLEYFKVSELKSLIADMNVLLNDKAIISSIIDYSDHYSHTDKNISPLNFLKYSDEEWEKFNNKYLYQNRLRHLDYKDLFLQNSFRIVKEIIGDKFINKSNFYKRFINRKDSNILWGYYLVQKQL